MKRSHWLLIGLTAILIGVSGDSLSYAEANVIDKLFDRIFKQTTVSVNLEPETRNAKEEVPMTAEVTEKVEGEKKADVTNEAKKNVALNVVPKKEPVNEPEIEEVEAKFPKPDVIKGIYLTAYTMTTPRGMELIDQMIASGGNAVVIDIEHGGGRLAFTPKNELLKQWNPGSNTLDHLPELIEELHEKGVYVIARQVVFNDPYTSSRKPEWRINSRWGGTFDHKWLDPSRPGVQNYNLYILREVAELGFDEIQFDYIRFPATNHRNNDYYFDESKFDQADVITDFLKKARRVADHYDVQLSADVFGAIVWGDIDWRIVGQDTARMAEYLDAIYPMTYPSHVSPGYYGFQYVRTQPYNFINQSIANFVEKAAGKAEIRTWIQGFPLRAPTFGTKYMEDQMRGTYDAGGTGWIIWSPGNIYTLAWDAFDTNPAELELVELEQGTGGETLHSSP